MHQAHRRFEAVLELLSAGAVIEQVSDAPLTYTLKVGREAVPIDGGLVQQLLAARRIRAACRVSGRLRYVAA